MITALLAAADPSLIPPRDEFGLPAWLWLFHILLPFTFALHAVFMNFAMGGAIVIPFLWIAGRRRARPELVNVARTALRMMPIAISFTITTGVAVLLFVQVVYGQFFYTANILMGWHWLAILAYLMLGFYLVYAADALLHRNRFGWGMTMLIVAALAFLSIAHVFNNNAILAIRPALCAQYTMATASTPETRCGRPATCTASSAPSPSPDSGSPRWAASLDRFPSNLAARQ